MHMFKYVFEFVYGDMTMFSSSVCALMHSKIKIKVAFWVSRNIIIRSCTNHVLEQHEIRSTFRIETPGDIYVGTFVIFLLYSLNSSLHFFHATFQLRFNYLLTLQFPCDFLNAASLSVRWVSPHTHTKLQLSVRYLLIKVITQPRDNSRPAVMFKVRQSVQQFFRCSKVDNACCAITLLVTLAKRWTH